MKSTVWIGAEKYFGQQCRRICDFSKPFPGLSAAGWAGVAETPDHCFQARVNSNVAEISRKRGRWNQENTHGYSAPETATGSEHGMVYATERAFRDRREIRRSPAVSTKIRTPCGGFS